MTNSARILFGVLALILCPLTAHAYIGPGVGLTFMGALLGIIGTTLLAFFGMFHVIFKRFMRNIFKSKRRKENDGQEGTPSEDSREEDAGVE